MADGASAPKVYDYTPAQTMKMLPGAVDENQSGKGIKTISFCFDFTATGAVLSKLLKKHGALMPPESNVDVDSMFTVIKAMSKDQAEDFSTMFYVQILKHSAEEAMIVNSKK